MDMEPAPAGLTGMVRLDSYVVLYGRGMARHGRGSAAVQKIGGVASNVAPPGAALLGRCFNRRVAICGAASSS